MKQLIPYLMLMPLLLWSCSSDDDSGLLPQGQFPIELSATVESAATLLRNTANIGNVGVTISGGSTYGNVQYTGTDGTLSSEATCYWQSKQDINIYAYAPYQAAAPTDISVQADQSNIANYNAAAGYLIATQTATFANKNNISLTFRHRLSRIAVTLVAGEGVTDTDLANATVSIDGTATSANIDQSGGTLSGLSNVQLITSNKTGDRKYQAIVVPQTVATGTTLLQISNVGMLSFSYALPADQEFKQGEQYNYTVTVSQSEGISVNLETINAWTQEDKNGGATATPTILYKVGDYYPDPAATTPDGGTTWTGTQPIGVVIWVDPADNHHGRIIALDEQSGMQWSTVNIDTQARNSEGRVNMRIIYNLDNDFSDYPVFAWVHSRNSPTEDYSNVIATGVWYLPTYEDIKSPRAWNNYIVNSKIIDAGGTGIINKTYLTSQERDNDYLLAITINAGSMIGGSSEKQTIGTARCVLEF